MTIEQIILLVIALCGVISRILPEGKAKNVFSALGTLPIQAAKAAMANKEDPK